jgi:hypothetical protein
MFCPECGQVYYTKGNLSNHPQPDWQNKNRIKDIKDKIASHIKKVDFEILPNFIKDYTEILEKELSKEELNIIKNYAKANCLLKEGN